jgi:hypothetical protein
MLLIVFFFFSVNLVCTLLVKLFFKKYNLVPCS